MSTALDDLRQALVDMGNAANETAERLKEIMNISIPPFIRQVDDLGRQIIVVDDRYAYVWDGDGNIRVGNRVHCPGNNAGWWGTVTQLGSDYPGYMRVVLTKE